MKFNIFSTLLCIFLFGFVDAFASSEDTAKKEARIPTVINYIEGDAFSLPQFLFHSLDTTLDDIEIANPAIGKHYNYLSNAGSAVSPQIFSLPVNLFTCAGLSMYDLYLFKTENIRYFKTNKAFSELRYHLAGGKEQQLTVALSENIRKNWNIGLDFNRLGSTGFLKNGTTFHTNIDLYTWLHSNDKRYNLLASATWNTIENKVNGGLFSDSIYDNNSVNNLALQGLLVNLKDAEHRFRDRKFSLRQFYDFRFHKEEISIDSSIKSNFHPSARISHAVSMEERSFTYQDSNSENYYRHSYVSASSLDSLHYYDLRNRFSFASVLNNKNFTDSAKSVYYSISLEHQWLKYSQSSDSKRTFNDIMQNVSIAGKVSSYEDEKKLFWKVTGESVFSGANKSDYKGEALLHTPLSDYGTIDLSGKLSLSSPELIYRVYKSNHFGWGNYFERSQVKKISLNYSYPRYDVTAGIELTTAGKFIYFDSTAVAMQDQNEIHVLKYSLNKNFHLGKFRFNNSFILQKVNREETLHLPKLISTQSLFYESFFYRNALLLRVGFDLHFNSSYYADAFMPATGLFYWQNEKKTGGFPLVDFFVNFRIKTARMFLKFENIGDNFLGKGYYFTPHYPMQGMTLQFGVVWRFFDQ